METQLHFGRMICCAHIRADGFLYEIYNLSGAPNLDKMREPVWELNASTRNRSQSDTHAKTTTILNTYFTESNAFSLAYIIHSMHVAGTGNSKPNNNYHKMDPGLDRPHLIRQPKHREPDNKNWKPKTTIICKLGCGPIISGLLRNCKSIAHRRCCRRRHRWPFVRKSMRRHRFLIISSTGLYTNCNRINDLLC